MISSMPLTDVLRKRDKSPSKSLGLKIPRLENLIFDGTVSRSPSPVTASTSGTSQNAIQVRGRLKRGISSIRSFFNSKTDDPDTPDSSVIITRSNSRGGFADLACSPPLMLHLKGLSKDNHSFQTNGNTYNAPIASTENYSIQTGTSTGIKKQLSQNLSCPIKSSPTVIIKSQLRERPSVQTLSGVSSRLEKSYLENVCTTISITPTHKSAIERLHQVSNHTNGTREALIAQHVTASLLSYAKGNIFQRNLMPICEDNNRGQITIRTVEATAIAK